LINLDIEKSEPDCHPFSVKGTAEQWLRVCIKVNNPNYLLMRGGSRNAIAKNKVAIAQAKIRIYATASIILKFLDPFT
jgi:hypothetical protein